LLSYGPTVFP